MTQGPPRSGGPSTGTSAAGRNVDPGFDRSLAATGLDHDDVAEHRGPDVGAQLEPDEDHVEATGGQCAGGLALAAWIEAHRGERGVAVDCGRRGGAVDIHVDVRQAEFDGRKVREVQLVGQDRVPHGGKGRGREGYSDPDRRWKGVLRDHLSGEPSQPEQRRETTEQRQFHAKKKPAGTGSAQAMNILDAIGNTTMVQLRRITPANGARILVKCEWENPTGSMKDRMALAAIARAEADGRLKPGGTVIEYTGGSTGASLAMVCAAKGYRIRIVTSDAFAREKLDQMRAFGAGLVIVPSEGGKTTKKLINDMIEVARKLSEEPETFWTDQLQNRDSIAGYYPLGEEIWQQSGGQVDAFVQSVGTSASIQGVAQALRKQNPKVRIVAVEPGESAVLSGGEAGPHKIEGVGIGRTPPMWDPAIIDEVVAVPTDAATQMARRLAKEEALFAGTSSGANVIAALKVAEQLGPASTVVTLMVDSGLKYTGTDVYRTASG